MEVNKLNNYELMFRRYGGVTTLVLIVISILSVAVVINKIRTLYSKDIYDIGDSNSNNLEVLIKIKEIELYHNMWILRFSYLVAPLLGILGTVLGLINAFSSIETSKEIVSASIS